MLDSPANTPSRGFTDSHAPFVTAQHRVRRRLCGRVRRAVPVIIAIVLTLSVVPGVGAAQQSQSSVDEAVEAKERAEALLGELETLADRPGVSIDADVLSSVQHNIDSGELDFTDEQYAAAVEHYERAIEQAEAELTGGYVQAAAVTLDTVDQRVTAVTDQGFRTTETAAIQTEADAVRAQIDSVDSYADARAVHEDAQTLEEQAQDLPTADMVGTAQTLESLHELRYIIVVGMALVGGVLVASYLAIRRRISRDTSEVPTY